nr:hypothetical protein Iba_chr08dCG11260 [Ipomoea batatas]
MPIVHSCHNHEPPRSPKVVACCSLFVDELLHRCCAVELHRRIVLLLRERKITVAAWNHDPAPMSPPAAVAGTTPTPYVARYRSTPFMEIAIALLCCAKENKGEEDAPLSPPVLLCRWRRR